MKEWSQECLVLDLVSIRPSSVKKWAHGYIVNTMYKAVSLLVILRGFLDRCVEANGTALQEHRCLHLFAESQENQISELLWIAYLMTLKIYQMPWRWGDKRPYPSLLMFQYSFVFTGTLFFKTDYRFSTCKFKTNRHKSLYSLNLIAFQHFCVLILFRISFYSFKHFHNMTI